ncbi:alpha/beta fold hydrolase [Actinoplanes sp. NPDC051861]|uniref:alpha/beta fold hydrolase n=1 Tax=Actinoplanes sp. NPDC051861 TaxID=3155170 RepID=UPI00343311F6
MTLAHDVTGDGPAVLLLHSTVCDRRMWDPQVPVLAAAGFRVIRCDLPGYGESAVPPEPYDEAALVADLLPENGAAVVGASGGGKVALELATRRPERVTALALLCTAMAGHEPSDALREFGDREDALLEAGDVAGATDLNVDLWVGPEADQATRAKVREMQHHAFEVQLAAPADTGPIRAEPDYARITAPTLLFSGAHDLPDFRDIAAHLATLLPRARHTELDWAGHLPNLERPDLLNPLLIGFLTSD